MRIVIRVVSVSQEHEVKEFVERVRYEDLLVRWLDRIYSIRSEIYNIKEPKDYYLAVKRYADHVRALYLMLLPPMKRMVRERVGEKLEGLFVAVYMFSDLHRGKILHVQVYHPNALRDFVVDELERVKGEVNADNIEELIRLAVDRVFKRFKSDESRFREIDRLSAKGCDYLLEYADIVLEAIVDVLYESGYLTERERVPVGMME